MTKYRQDFEIHQGDHKQVTFAVVDEAGAAKALTSSTQEWRAYQGATVKITVLNAAISLVNVDGTDDGVRFTLAPADTSALDPGVYQHELEVTDSGGNVSTVTRGTMTVKDDLV
jgi:hypothetical protein